MILEVVIANVKKGLSKDFENSFKEAEKIILSQKGYISHQLKKGVEQQDKYILLIEWETLEAHEEGFRKSEDYKRWKALLHHFYESSPSIEHYQ